MEFLIQKRHPIQNRNSIRLMVCLLIMMLVSLEPAFMVSASAKTISEEQLPSLHAALVLKIAMFVNWSTEIPECAEGKFPLTVVGDDDVFSAFHEFSHKKINGKELLLTQEDSFEKLKAGRILFISSNFLSGKNIQQTMKNIPPGILTISDDPHFNTIGGMIKISIENGRPRFTINLEAASDSGIKFSSKLLKIATIYKEGTS